MSEDLVRLAELVKRRNALESEITELIDRPAAIGHIGEYIASRVFGITLETSASAKAIDGRFSDGPLKGKSVNIKWYAMREASLDITLGSSPDYYLAMVGPRSSIMVSRGRTRHWLIESVHLFNAKALTAELQRRGVVIGTACSVAQSFWASAEIYPTPTNRDLELSQAQLGQIKLFSAQ